MNNNIAVGILASGAQNEHPVTVAAQRWTFTSFHLYTLASGLAGYRDDMKL